MNTAFRGVSILGLGVSGLAVGPQLDKAVTMISERDVRSCLVFNIG